MAALTASCIDLNIQGNGAYSILKQLATMALQEDLVGEIKDIPIEVVHKMVERCLEENEVNIITKLQISRLDGFTLRNSIEGYDFWDEVICWKNFNLFFEKYPKF